jgi:predicted ester cyclase
MAAESEHLVRRFFDEVINGKNLDTADEFISPTYVNYGFPGVPPGPEGLKGVLGMFFTAFPDMKVNVDEVIADGDRITTRGRMTGTHNGEFQGIPATGRSIDIGYIDIWRAEDGMLVENWVEMDRLGMMQQLGVVPGQE